MRKIGVDVRYQETSTLRKTQREEEAKTGRCQTETAETSDDIRELSVVGKVI